MQEDRPGELGRLNPRVMALLVFGVALACNWPPSHGAFHWDDPALVTKPELRTWTGLARIWTDPRSTQQYYPVLFSAFWIEHRLWGDATLGCHLVNVLLHAASACLLALVLRRLCRPHPRRGNRREAMPRPFRSSWYSKVSVNAMVGNTVESMRPPAPSGLRRDRLRWLARAVLSAEASAKADARDNCRRTKPSVAKPMEGNFTCSR